MDIKHISSNNNVLVITPSFNILDAKETPLFKEKIMDLISSSKKNWVVIDLHNLRSIDSSGLGSFLWILRMLNTNGGELKLACLNKPIKTIFELVSMQKIFEIFDTTQDAINSFKN